MNYVFLSLVLLGIGFFGLLAKRSLLKILISIEVIATAATMNFILLASSAGKALGEALLILAFSTDACVSAAILSLFVIVAKKYRKRDVSELTKLKEPGEAKDASKDE
jgi:NADH-quinone oxidoreductase subunit K